MAIAPEHLVVRTPILDRNQEIAFHHLSMKACDADAVLPLMLHLSNVEAPLATCFIPLAWTTDAVLLGKLTRNTVLIADEINEHNLTMLAQVVADGYRIGLRVDGTLPTEIDPDFRLLPFDGNIRRLTPGCVLTDITNPADFRQAASSPAMYFNGSIDMLPVPESRRNTPAHTIILELMGAVQQEASPKDIETIFKRDVALSFKLLRYINSPWFGLASHVESLRHALSILGYQPLLKWLALLAMTAGQAASPAVTQTAMIRARLLELIGNKKLERRDADNLFLIGMLSLLDRIMGMPLAEILTRANLPPAICDALIQGEGKYRRYLDLALACEGLLDEDKLDSLPDVDARTVNLAHLEAIEWAAQISGAQLT